MILNYRNGNYLSEVKIKNDYAKLIINSPKYGIFTVRVKYQQLSI